MGYQTVLKREERGTLASAGNPSRSKKIKINVTNRMLE
jgi:hypothetical protein